MLCDKVLYEFENLCSHIGDTAYMHLNQILFGLGTLFFLVNILSNQNCSVHSIMCELKVRNYAAHMVELNKYLAVFNGSKASEKLEIYN